MGKHTAWIDYAGHRILIVAFAGISDEQEFLAVFDELEQDVVHSQKGKSVPMIVDLSNTRLSSTYTARGRAFLEAMAAAKIPNSPAVLVGVSGLQKAAISAFSIFRHDIFTCDTVDEAKVILAKHFREHKELV